MQFPDKVNGLDVVLAGMYRYGCPGAMVVVCDKGKEVFGRPEFVCWVYEQGVAHWGVYGTKDDAVRAFVDRVGLRAAIEAA